MRNRIQIAFDLGSHSIKSAAGRILPNGKIEVLSISSLMSEAIKRIANSNSVSDLFN